MINFLSKKKSSITFKKKVLVFWKWFEKKAPYLHEQVRSGQSAQLSDETIRQIDQLMPGLAWCYGPSKKENCYSFTLSPEANRSFQFLTRFWLESAPNIDGWEFHCDRQPSTHPHGQSITIANRTFKIDELWLKPEIDEETYMVNISVWHPHFDEMDDNARFQKNLHCCSHWR